MVYACINDFDCNLIRLIVICLERSVISFFDIGCNTRATFVRPKDMSKFQKNAKLMKRSIMNYLGIGQLWALIKHYNFKIQRRTC